MREYRTHKIHAAAALLLIAGFLSAASVPAAAAVNPFMDVPVGHWAYDAIGMLAANGVLSGYPDGAYKGRQAVTRYEMASGLARALALADMATASKEDAEILTRLVVEFQDELDALGVRMEDISGKVSSLEENLGGWRLSGSLVMDIDDKELNSNSEPDLRDGYVSFSKARLFLDRWFGENGDMLFHATIEQIGNNFSFQTFYVEFPAFFDTTLTVGRFEWDLESAYNFNTGGISDLGVGSYMTDRTMEGFGVTKNFSLGTFQAYIQRNTGDFAPYYGFSYDVWELTAQASLQFTEQFGFDLGAQYLLGDDASSWSNTTLYEYDGTGYLDIRFRFDDMYTLFAGLRFDFTPNIALKGIYYHQGAMDDEWYDGDVVLPDIPAWASTGADNNTSAYRIMLDVKQEQLGFTSLWLGYDFMEAGFYAFSGDGEFSIPVRVFDSDMHTYRVGATQQWNEKWRTWEYFGYHDMDESDNAVQWGLGAEYRLNQNVAFALNYVNLDYDAADWSAFDDHLIRFRTQIDF